jgi:hypothetical protein
LVRSETNYYGRSANFTAYFRRSMISCRSVKGAIIA